MLTDRLTEQTYAGAAYAEPTSWLKIKNRD